MSKAHELRAQRKINRRVNIIRRRLLYSRQFRVSFEPFVDTLLIMMRAQFREEYGGNDRDLMSFETHVRNEVDRLTPDFLLLYQQARVQGLSPLKARRLMVQKLRTTKAQLNTLIITLSQHSAMSGVWHGAQNDERVWGFRYRTQDDERVRWSHERLEFVTLPKDHRFWLKYFPPNGYGCRCGIQVLKRRVRIIQPPKRVIGIDQQFKGHIGKIFSTFV